MYPCESVHLRDLQLTSTRFAGLMVTVLFSRVYEVLQFNGCHVLSLTNTFVIHLFFFLFLVNLYQQV